MVALEFPDTLLQRFVVKVRVQGLGSIAVVDRCEALERAFEDLLSRGDFVDRLVGFDGVASGLG